MVSRLPRCLNENGSGPAEFVHDPVVHNDRTLTVASSRTSFAATAAEIPDLYYEIRAAGIEGETGGVPHRSTAPQRASRSCLPPPTDLVVEQCSTVPRTD